MSNFEDCWYEDTCEESEDSQDYEGFRGMEAFSVGLHYSSFFLGSLGVIVTAAPVSEMTMYSWSFSVSFMT